MASSDLWLGTVAEAAAEMEMGGAPSEALAHRRKDRQ